MKYFNNALKGPLTDHLIKKIRHHGVKVLGPPSSQIIYAKEVKDKINPGFKVKQYPPQVFSPVPFVTTKKLNGFFNFFKPLAIEKIGLSQVMHKKFHFFHAGCKYGKPLNIWLFQKLFRENKDILLDFITKVLPDKHVKEIEVIIPHKKKFPFE